MISGLWQTTEIPTIERLTIVIHQLSTTIFHRSITEVLLICLHGQRSKILEKAIQMRHTCYLVFSSSIFETGLTRHARSSLKSVTDVLSTRLFLSITVLRNSIPALSDLMKVSVNLIHVKRKRDIVWRCFNLILA